MQLIMLCSILRDKSCFRKWWLYPVTHARENLYAVNGNMDSYAVKNILIFVWVKQPTWHKTSVQYTLIIIIFFSFTASVLIILCLYTCMFSTCMFIWYTNTHTTVFSISTQLLLLLRRTYIWWLCVYSVKVSSG